jgi:hypothetical protein
MVFVGCVPAKSVVQTTETTPTVHKVFYPTYLDQFLAQGRDKIEVRVWNELQEVPANVYIVGGLKNYPDSKANIRIRVFSENTDGLDTGNLTSDGYTIIWYNFGSDSSGSH